MLLGESKKRISIIVLFFFSTLVQGEEIHLELIKKLSWYNQDKPYLNNICEYPFSARYVGKISKKRLLNECPIIKDYLEEVHNKDLYLEFAGNNIMTPASAYGHVFLRIGADKANLLDTVYDYAADTRNSTGLSYFFNALTESFSGSFRKSVYFDKIKIYNEIEKRDIWSYKISSDTNTLERSALLYLELKHQRYPYNFFNDNCSSKISEFLTIALNNDRDYSLNGPIDLPLRLVKNYNNKEIITSSNVLENEAKVLKNLKFSSNQSCKEKYSFLDNDNQNFKNIFNNSTEADSRYNNIAENKVSFNCNSNDKEHSPLDDHEEIRSSFYANEDYLLIDLKFGLHSITDFKEHSIENSTLDIMNFTIKRDFDKTSLKKVKVLEIDNYLPLNESSFLPSWGFKAEYLNLDKDNYQLSFKVGLGIEYEQLFIAVNALTSFDLNGFDTYLSPNLYIKYNLSQLAGVDLFWSEFTRKDGRKKQSLTEESNIRLNYKFDKQLDFGLFKNIETPLIGVYAKLYF